MKEIRVLIKKERLLFFILILQIFFLTGCVLFDKEKNDINWEDEVLLAKECGMDGLACCKDEPSCFYGQVCCTNPRNSSINYCAKDCDFGKDGTFCRKDEPGCENGTTCVDDYCQLCGGETEPCCSEGDQCNGDLVCYKDKCVGCGQAGTPCCATGAECFGQVSENSTHTECRDGVCVYCGFNSKVSCLSDPKCLKGHLLNNDTCLRCGDFNLPCCDQEINGYQCLEDKNLVCELGFCNKK